jgi:hypothetical protein
MRRRRLIILVFFGAVASLGACGTDAVGVDDCNTIEDALCRQAAAIPCPEDDLPHSGDGVAACIRFYSVACLHGLVTTLAPMKGEVTACVDAINALPLDTTSCTIINLPESAPDGACAWLIAPEAGVDAEAGSAAADSADAGDAEAGNVDAAGDATSDVLVDANHDGSDGGEGG